MYNQTNEFVCFGGDANHNADLSIEVNRRIRNAWHGAASGITPSNCTTNTAIRSRSTQTGHKENSSGQRLATIVPVDAQSCSKMYNKSLFDKQQFPNHVDARRSPIFLCQLLPVLLLRSSCDVAYAVRG